jgi:hypothetical protein
VSESLLISRVGADLARGWVGSAVALELALALAVVEFASWNACDFEVATREAP